MRASIAAEVTYRISSNWTTGRHELKHRNDWVDVDGQNDWNKAEAQNDRTVLSGQGLNNIPLGDEAN